MQWDYKMGVTLINSMGDDNTICNAARVSTGNHEVGYKESKGLINYLIREKHVSTLEHNTFTFKVSVPMFIARQIQRHRTFSYNEISGRYSELELKFWTPPADRPLKNKGSGAYPELVTHNNHVEMMGATHSAIAYVSEHAEATYNSMLANGVATEVARAVLPMNFYTEFYISGNLKNFLDFIEKRVVPNAQLEVQEVATKMLEEIEKVVPIATAAWKEHNVGK